MPPQHARTESSPELEALCYLGLVYSVLGGRRGENALYSVRRPTSPI